jgi:NADH-ubiquinone oxidoreductase chain 5
VLILLAIPSIFIGYYTTDLFVGFGSNFFSNNISISLYLYRFLDIEFILLVFKLLPISFSLIGTILALGYYHYFLYITFKIKTINYMCKLYCFFNKKWFFDKVYNEIFGQLAFKLGYTFSYKLVDKGLFEYLGPTGIVNLSLNFSLFYSKFQTNHIYHLLLTILIGTVLLIFQLFLYKAFSLNTLVVGLVVLLVNL